MKGSVRNSSYSSGKYTINVSITVYLTVADSRSYSHCKHTPPTHKEQCEVIDVLIILILVIIPQCNICQIITLYTLNTYNYICQLSHDQVRGENKR